MKLSAKHKNLIFNIGGISLIVFTIACFGYIVHNSSMEAKELAAQFDREKVRKIVMIVPTSDLKEIRVEVHLRGKITSERQQLIEQFITEYIGKKLYEQIWNSYAGYVLSGMNIELKLKRQGIPVIFANVFKDTEKTVCSDVECRLVPYDYVLKENEHNIY